MRLATDNPAVTAGADSGPANPIIAGLNAFPKVLMIRVFFKKRLMSLPMFPFPIPI
jgi:hypothetical protein